MGVSTCTGLTAVWCPICGDCQCPETATGERSLTDEACALHSTRSPHAEPERESSSRPGAWLVLPVSPAAVEDHDLSCLLCGSQAGPPVEFVVRYRTASQTVVAGLHAQCWRRSCK